jgi:hypothetical protein
MTELIEKLQALRDQLDALIEEAKVANDVARIDAVQQSVPEDHIDA